MNNYQDLKVWQKAMNLVENIYQVINTFPNEEKFGLVSQMKRSSISIPSNIAEGAGRNHQKEFRNFLSIANGSTSELETQIILASKLNFINDNETEKLVSQCVEIRKMNYALQRSLQKTN